MKYGTDYKKSQFAQVLQPENELEYAFLEDKDFLYGLDWGTPRYGHPEGEVYKHIREVLDNIDLLALDPGYRSKLRIIAFVHDTFKYKEHKGHPRDWDRHHAIFARQFLETYTSDPAMLTITQWHDEAYYCWCTEFLYHKPERARLRLTDLLNRLSDFIQLYYLFFLCDTRTGDKNLAPLKWFEQRVAGVEPVHLT